MGWRELSTLGDNRHGRPTNLTSYWLVSIQVNALDNTGCPDRGLITREVAYTLRRTRYVPFYIYFGGVH